MLSENLILNPNGLKFDKGIHIDAKVNLDIFSESADSVIRISNRGEVIGDLTAENVLVNGKVKGNIVAKEMVEVTENAKVFGSVTCKKFVGNRKSVYQGRIVERKH